MVFPYHLMTAISVAGSYLVSSGRIPQIPSLSFLTCFAALWATQFLLWAVWAVILYPKVFSPLRGLPEPSGNSWFMGQFPTIRRLRTGEPMIEWMNSIPNDGLIRYLGPLNMERLVPTSPKALAEVLATKNYDFPKPSHFRHTIGRILGVGLLLAEGDEHKVQRRNLLPAFGFRHIKDLYPVFWKKASEGVEAMTQQILQDAAQASGEAKTAVFEAGGWASRITLDIIGVAGLGRDFGAIKDPNNELSKAYWRLFAPNRQARILNLLELVIPPRLISALPVRRNFDIRSAARFIRGVCAELIEDKEKSLGRKDSVDLDILSVALQSGGFTREDLIDQLMTFLAAGHETTASALTWAAYLLAKNPDMQARLRAEVRAHLPPPTTTTTTTTAAAAAAAAGDVGDDQPHATVSSIDIDRMPYLNAFCNEVLRYFSPAPMTVRVSAVDTTILGHFVPKGTQIMIVPWAINKSRALWGADAHVFNPDRWLDGSGRFVASGGAASNYAFMTFLHGPRSCIGQAFARAELACLVASWVGRFALELRDEELADEEKLVIKGGLTARPANGMHLRATVLDGW
ncbi:hypothetical protein VTK26DRAFT_3910 [Humicola hyalothermophila]